MKKILILLSILAATGFLSQAQDDCLNYIQVINDEVDGSVIVGSRFPIINSSGEQSIAMSMLIGPDGAYVLSFKCNEGKGCISTGDKINILFTNGDRMELLNERDFNCDGKSLVRLKPGDTTRSLVQLKEKRIKIIRIWIGDNFVQQELSAVNAMMFQEMLLCLINHQL